MSQNKSPMHHYPSAIQARAKPKILKRYQPQVAKNLIVEHIELQFSNQQQRTYECLKSGKRGAVLIIAVDAQRHVLLLREYCGGRESYELAFPKGKLEANESHQQAAVRELQEETGYAAKKITPIKSVSIAPGYMGHITHIMLAEQLYWQPLIGDEPEPLEIFRWPLDNVNELLQRPDFTEARSIVALLMLQHYPQLQYLTEINDTATK